MATRRKASDPQDHASDDRADQSGTDETPVLVGSGLGQVAYDAYSAEVGGKSVRGEKLPAWGDQDPKIQAAWCAVGQAVVSATFSRKD